MLLVMSMKSHSVLPTWKGAEMEDAWAGFKGFAVLMTCLIINFSSAFACLVVLHYMEHTNLELVIASLAVYMYIAMMTIVVAVNRA